MDEHSSFGMTQAMHTLTTLALVFSLLSSLSVTTSMDRQNYGYSMKNIPTPSEKRVQNRVPQ